MATAMLCLMNSPIRSWGNSSTVKPTYGLLFSPTLWKIYDWCRLEPVQSMTEIVLKQRRQKRYDTSNNPL